LQHTQSFSERRETGSFTYSKAFGVRFVAQEHEHEHEQQSQRVPLDINAIMLLASCSKLLTTIAALQCVEKGLVGLDEDLAGSLPELAEVGILSETDPDSPLPHATGEGERKPVVKLKERENKLTLR
jgi:CubicO group peptidase (beta-lactamase class C family)